MTAKKRDRIKKNYLGKINKNRAHRSGNLHQIRNERTPFHVVGIVKIKVELLYIFYLRTIVNGKQYFFYPVSVHCFAALKEG